MQASNWALSPILTGILAVCYNCFDFGGVEIENVEALDADSTGSSCRS